MYIIIHNKNISLTREVNKLKNFDYKVDLKNTEVALSSLRRQIHLLAHLYPTDNFTVEVRSDSDDYMDDLITYLSENTREIPLKIKLSFINEEKEIDGTGIIRLDYISSLSNANEEFQTKKMSDLCNKLNQNLALALSVKKQEYAPALYVLAHNAQFKFIHLNGLPEYEEFIKVFTQFTLMLGPAKGSVKDNLETLLTNALFLFRKVDKNSFLKNLYYFATYFSVEELKKTTHLLSSLLDVIENNQEKINRNQSHKDRQLLNHIAQLRATQNSNLLSYMIIGSFTVTFPLIHIFLTGITFIPPVALAMLIIVVASSCFYFSLTGMINLGKQKEIKNTKENLIEAAKGLSHSRSTMLPFFNKKPISTDQDKTTDCDISSLNYQN
ncbi:MAG TPA: hypothetical protein PK657_06630 [Legionella sp.]|nr:hypothetical protein [Legionella sp.]